LSLFRPDSIVSHINRRAGSGPVAVDAETFELLCLCEEVRRASGGAFDIAVGGLMEAWGFRGVAGDREAQPAVRPARSREPGGDGAAMDLDRTARTVRFARSGVSLDLGAIGKGFALDAAAGILRDAGVACALLHAGTSSTI